MNINYDPLWDERGELRRGCTVREALAWLTGCGSHSAGETVFINGVRTSSAACSMARTGRS